MNGCQCKGIETQFNKQYVYSELSRYRKKGPSKTTGLLVNALKAQNIEGKTILDIGGGIGTIQHELLKAGAKQTVAVEASTAAISAAQEEAARQGHADQISFKHGNFVDLAADIPSADIVTLDRVICCYHDMRALVSLSTAHAAELYGLVYPRANWWIKTAFAIQNFVFRLRGNPFRIFVHPIEEVETIISHAGLKRRYYAQTFLWQVVVFGR